MKNWDDLSMAEKSEMIGVAVRNGITDLPAIRQKYNEFAEGGEKESDNRASMSMADRLANAKRAAFYTRRNRPEPGRFGGGSFGGTGAGGSFEIRGNIFPFAKDFNTAYDMAVAARMSEFTYNNKRYNTKKENNPIREINNRLAGQLRVRDEKADSVYDHVPYFFGSMVENTPMITDRNFKAEGGELPIYSAGRVAGALWGLPNQEYLGEPSHHYDFTQSEEWANAHGYYPDARGHRDDRVKKPAHPSHPSKGTWAKDGRIFNLTDIGMKDPNYIFFGLADGGQDPQATLMYNGATVLPELTVTPKGNYYLNPYDNMRLSYAEGGNLYGNGGTTSLVSLINIPGTLKGISEAVKERAYKTITPHNYDIPRAAKEFISGRERDLKGIAPVRNEEWAKYLGVPYEGESNFEPSPYRPTKGQTYDTVLKFKDESQIVSDEVINQMLERQKKTGKNSFLVTGNGGGLGSYTLSLGEDEKGKYISYYDDWDINPFKGISARTKIPVISNVENIVPGSHPFTVYGRRYYEEKKPSKEKAHGGPLVEGAVNYFENGGLKEKDRFATTEMPELVVSAKRKYIAGYDESGNPIYTTDRTKSMSYEGVRPSESKYQRWANRDKNAPKYTDPIIKAAQIGIGVPLAATTAPATIGTLFEAAAPVLSRPLTTVTEAASEYLPAFSRVLPYTEAADKGLMGILGTKGMYDSGKDWYEGNIPWYQAVPQIGLSGLLVADAAPLLGKGYKTALYGIGKYGGSDYAKAKLISDEMIPVSSKIATVNKAFRNEEWNNFLDTKSGDNYYRLVNKIKESKYGYNPEETYFISHTTPWEEFSGINIGISDPQMIASDAPNGYKRLYEFPTKTFGKLKSTDFEGIPTDFDVTEMGKKHLLYGKSSSRTVAPVRALSDENAASLGVSPYSMGNIDRPLDYNGLYVDTPIYENIFMGNQTTVKGDVLKDVLENTDYNIFEYTPEGIQKIIHTSK